MGHFVKEAGYARSTQQRGLWPCRICDDAGHGHIVCKSRICDANGPRESIGVYGYDEVTSAYFYEAFSSRGNRDQERGHRITGGFRFPSEAGTGSAKTFSRFTIVETGPEQVRTVLETSKRDGPWEVTETRDYRRSRASLPLPRPISPPGT